MTRRERLARQELRDKFASASLSGVLARGLMHRVDETGAEYRLRIARIAYRYADAMLKAREEKRK